MSVSQEDKRIAEQYFETAKKMVLDGEELTRVFFVTDHAGKMHVIAAPSGGPDADTAMVNFLRAMFAVLNAVSYCMISEVWISEKPEYAGRVSEDPDRTEAIIMLATRRVRGESGEYKDVSVSGRAMIQRDPVRVGDLQWDDFAVIGGRFTTLLPPHDLPKCPSDLQPELLAGLGRSVAQMGGRFEEWKPTVH